MANIDATMTKKAPTATRRERRRANRLTYVRLSYNKSHKSGDSVYMPAGLNDFAEMIEHRLHVIAKAYQRYAIAYKLQHGRDFAAPWNEHRSLTDYILSIGTKKEAHHFLRAAQTVEKEIKQQAWGDTLRDDVRRLFGYRQERRNALAYSQYRQRGLGDRLVILCEEDYEKYRQRIDKKFEARAKVFRSLESYAESNNERRRAYKAECGRRWR